MTDRRVREQERRWREGGDPAEEERWLRERLRAGSIDPLRLEAASFIEHPPARRIVGPPPGLDRAALERQSVRGVEVHALEEPPLAALVRLTGWSGDPRRVEQVLEAVVEQGALSVLLEVADVSAFSSSFLGALVGSGHALQGRGGELLLLDLPGPLRTVVSALGLAGFLDLQPDRESARARARSGAWARVMERLGPEASARLGIAGLRVALPEWAEVAPHDPRLGRALIACDAWLADPRAELAILAGRACGDLWELWLSGTYGQHPALAWTCWLAQRLPSLTGAAEEPFDPARLASVHPRLLQRHVPAMREELLTWLLLA